MNPDEKHGSFFHTRRDAWVTRTEGASRPQPPRVPAVLQPAVNLLRGHEDLIVYGGPDP